MYEIIRIRRLIIFYSLLYHDNKRRNVLILFFSLLNFGALFDTSDLIITFFFYLIENMFVLVEQIVCILLVNNICIYISVAEAANLLTTDRAVLHYKRCQKGKKTGNRNSTGQWEEVFVSQKKCLFNYVKVYFRCLFWSHKIIWDEVSLPWKNLGQCFKRVLDRVAVVSAAGVATAS